MKPIFIPYTIYTTEEHRRYECPFEITTRRTLNQTIFKLTRELYLTELVKENLKYVNESI